MSEWQIYGGTEQAFQWIYVKADHFKVLRDGTLVLYRYCGGVGLDEPIEAYAPGQWRKIMERYALER